MKKSISIDSQGAAGKHGIYLDEQPSHHIRETELDQALTDARQNFWKTDADNDAQLGTRLYRMLSGSGGQIDKLLDESLQQGEPLSLLLDIPYELNALPFELLNDGQFLAQRAHPRTFIIRTVTHRKSRQERIAEKRPLKMLFMACSPMDLKTREVLSFEKEEELIFASVEQFAVDLSIEDSGCLGGLFETLFEEGPFDVVHITGHAGNDAQLGPVFYMEDDTGGLDKVTPQRLWDDALKHVPPELLFLSGCSTGKGCAVLGF